MIRRFRLDKSMNASLRTKDGYAILEIKCDKNEFKENDVVKTTLNGNPCISILKIHGEYRDLGVKQITTKASYIIGYDVLRKNGTIIDYDTIEHGDNYIDFIQDKLKEKCLMFDGSNIIKWRAKKQRRYFFINLNDVSSSLDYYGDSDDQRYDVGNYFPTEEMANDALSKYKEFLKLFHKNI